MEFKFFCPKCKKTKDGYVLYGKNVITYCCGERFTSDGSSSPKAEKPISKNKESNYADEEFHSFNAVLFIENDGWTMPVEIKRCSFGWLHGKIVAVDYG